MCDKLIFNNTVCKDLDEIALLSNLWIVDLSNNLLENVNGLRNYPALGFVNLAYNKLTWQSLECIKHIFIVDLIALGNFKLEIDDQYRQQLVSIFPRVFCLDGIFITVDERNSVKSFFERSNFQIKPVRKYLKDNCFRPTNQKFLRCHGKISHQAYQLLRQFPDEFPSLQEWNIRKSNYLFNYTMELLEVPNEIREDFKLLLDNVAQPDFLLDLNFILITLCLDLAFKMDFATLQLIFKHLQIELFNQSVCEYYYSLIGAHKLQIIRLLLVEYQCKHMQKSMQEYLPINIYNSICNLLWVHYRFVYSTNQQLEDLLNFYNNNHTKYKQLHKIYQYAISTLSADFFLQFSKSTNILSDISNGVLSSIIQAATGQKAILEFIENESLNMDQSTAVAIIIPQIAKHIQRIPHFLYPINLIYSIDNSSSNSKVRSRLNAMSHHLSYNVPLDNSAKVSTAQPTHQYSDSDYRTMQIGDQIIVGSQVTATVLNKPLKTEAIIQTIAEPKIQMHSQLGSIQRQLNSRIHRIQTSEYQWDGELNCWIPKDSTGDRIFLTQQTCSGDNATDSAFQHHQQQSIPSTITVVDEWMQFSAEGVSPPTTTASLSMRDSIRNNPRGSSEKQTVNRYSLHEPTSLFLYKAPQSSSVDRWDSLKAQIIPKLAQISFSKKKDLTYVGLAVSPTLHKTRRWTNEDGTVPDKSIVMKDVSAWLGGGKYIYPKVWWHPCNPDNWYKRRNMSAGWLQHI